MELKEKNKKFGPKRIINAIKNSISGLTAAYTSEPSLMILCLLSILQKTQGRVNNTC